MTFPNNILGVEKYYTWFYLNFITLWTLEDIYNNFQIKENQRNKIIWLLQNYNVEN
jgi:hypothetical protein